MNRKAKDLHAELTALGFVLVRSKRHLVYHHPGGGRPLTAPKSPSDKRATKNVRADAARILRGLEQAA